MIILKKITRVATKSKGPKKYKRNDHPKIDIFFYVSYLPNFNCSSIYYYKIYMKYSNIQY